MTDAEIDMITEAQWGPQQPGAMYAAHRAYARAVLKAALTAGVWLLSWEVENANEHTGTWAFTSEQAAVEQVLQWCADDFGEYTREEAKKLLLTTGELEINEDRKYFVYSSQVFDAPQ